MWDVAHVLGLNLGPLHWEHKVLATGSPVAKCLYLFFIYFWLLCPQDPEQCPAYSRLAINSEWICCEEPIHIQILVKVHFFLSTISIKHKVILPSGLSSHPRGLCNPLWKLLDNRSGSPSLGSIRIFMELVYSTDSKIFPQKLWFRRSTAWIQESTFARLYTSHEWCRQSQATTGSTFHVFGTLLFQLLIPGSTKMGKKLL